MADQIPDSAKSDSIYDIARNSPPFTWEERAAVDEVDVEAALGASVPGGSSVLAWLPMADGHTIHQTARDVMRAAIAAVDKARSTRAAPPAMDREAVEIFEGLNPHVVARIKHVLQTVANYADAERNGGEFADDLRRDIACMNGDVVADDLAQFTAALSTLSADAIRQGEGL